MLTKDQLKSFISFVVVLSLSMYIVYITINTLGDFSFLCILPVFFIIHIVQAFIFKWILVSPLIIQALMGVIRLAGIETTDSFSKLIQVVVILNVFLVFVITINIFKINFTAILRKNGISVDNDTNIDFD